MTAATVRMDLEFTRARTRWTMSMSFALHLLLFLWVVLHRASAPEIALITEITLLEPGDPASGSPAPSAPAQVRAEAARGLMAKADADAHFRRATPLSEMAPHPQESWAFADRLDARLAAMQQNALQVATGTAPSASAASLIGSGPATVATGTGVGAPIALSRGGGGSAPLPLAHGSGAGTAPILATVGGGPREADSPTPARSGDASGHRTVAGASISGPIADRPIMSYSVPSYPEWAKRDAVEGAVTLYFVVRPDGGVKENILVQKTAGFEEFDENARVALRSWRFKPLGAGRTGEQWGMITFHYRLQSAG